MLVRAGLGTRIGLSSRMGAVIEPQQIANCEGLWIAGRGMTFESGSLTEGSSNMSGWAKVNCTTTATTITDTADGGPVQHYARTSWFSHSAIAPYSGTIRRMGVQLIPGTITQCEIADFGGAWSIFFDMAAGKVGPMVNVADVQAVWGGGSTWTLSWRCTVPSGPTPALSTAKNGTTVYQGDGLGSFTAQAWYLDSDHRVAGIADLSGNGRDFTQTDQAYFQPWFIRDGGTPALLCDATYATKHFTRAYTAAFNTSEATFATWFRMLSYGTARSLGAPCRTSSGTECFDWWDSGTEYVARTTLGISASSGSSAGVRDMRILRIGPSNAASTYRGKALTPVQTGTIGAASGVTSTGHYLMSRSDLGVRMHGYWYGAAVFSRYLSDAEIAALARFGEAAFNTA